jgi:cobyric acid synthase
MQTSQTTKGKLFLSTDLNCILGRVKIIKYRIGRVRTPNQINDSGRPEGIISGMIMGTYVHGIRRSAEAKRKKFPRLGENDPSVDPLDRLADHLELAGWTMKL